MVSIGLQTATTYITASVLASQEAASSASSLSQNQPSAGLIGETDAESQNQPLAGLPVASRPMILICLIRGHVLRIGDRLCDNFDGDWQDLHEVFRSIKIETERIENYKLIFLLDVVAMDAEEQAKDKILHIVQEHVPLHAHRISSKALGEWQTDSLLKTLEWEQSQVAALDKRDHVTGCFVLRADCHLKPMIALQSWVERGMQYDRCVFPFMVWEDGGPADQLFFIPKSQREAFFWAVTKLSKYKPTSLQRQSLHWIHCKSCLKGRLSFHLKVVCDANSTKEWNPCYRIMGRSEKQQEECHRAKWGDHSILFQETS